MNVIRLLLLLGGGAFLSGTSAGCRSTQVYMSFDRSAGFYAAPFPSDDLVRADGSIALDAFPNPSHLPFVAQLLGVLTEARGFAVSGGVFFKLTAPLDVTKLPDVSQSTTAGASIFLVGVDPGAPDYMKRRPIEVRFSTDGGPYGDSNLLSLVPLQGVPLRAGSTYAAVILARTLDAEGHTLGAPRAMADLARGAIPAGMSPAAAKSYARALAALGQSGVAVTDIAALTVFTTGDPTVDLSRVRAAALARPLPSVNAPFHKVQDAESFCVYQSTIDMPVYQVGASPYLAFGGQWTFDAGGAPVYQHDETGNFYVTIPRAPMPPAGLPAVVFIRTGTSGPGTEPALANLGVRDAAGNTVDGTGPAMDISAAGFAGVSVDGPIGGLRNTTHGDEQFLIFNLFNPAALRDNIRQSAMELSVLAHVLPGVTLDVGDCAGAAGDGGGHIAHFDTSNLVLMGHSMGATIEPLTLSIEPMYRAAILSGAGASWIENVLYKQKPLPVMPVITAYLGFVTFPSFPPSVRDLTAGEPALTLLQWAGEPADPQVYDDRIVRAPRAGEKPRHVLMIQGIVDNYIRPQIANTTSLSLGLDLGGDSLDAATPALDAETPLRDVLGYSGRAQISLPATGNFASASGPITAVVVQHPADSIEDGHEVMFQTDPPKREYRCFLSTLLGCGAPQVVGVTDPPDAPCPTCP